MATEDWKIETKNKLETVFRNYNKDEALSIYFKNYFRNAVYNVAVWNTWHVGVGKDRFVKKFKTKSAALKFAKSYMRKH